MQRVLSLWPLSIVAWSLITGVVLAAEFRTDGRPIVDSDEVIEDDLYIFGEEIAIDGEVNGDVIAFGRVVRVNGTVEGDLIAAAQAVVVNGHIKDDVRMAGQVLKVGEEATIDDDVIAGGFSLEASDLTSIGGDVVYGGYQALLAGELGGTLKGALANCEIRGKIGGDAELMVDGDTAGPHSYTVGSPPPVSFPNVPPGLTIGDTATIEGRLAFHSRQEANVAEGAQILGGIEHEWPEFEAQKPPTAVQKAGGVLRRYITLLIIGLVVVLVAPRWTHQISDQIKGHPLASLGFGVVGIVGYFVLLLVILIAMIVIAVIAGLVQLTSLIPVVIVLGIAGGLLLVIAFWFFTVYLAGVLLSLLAGSWLLGFGGNALGENRYLSLVVGLVLLALITSVPYLGPVVGWLVVVLAIGALVGTLFWNRPTHPPVTEKQLA